MKLSQIAALVLGLLSISSLAHADDALRARVAHGLAQNDGWDPVYAEMIADSLEISFELHDAVGTLDDRIRELRRLNGSADAQRLAVLHPGYLDAFLIAPDEYVSALNALGSDQMGEEQLLAALLRRPSNEGIKDSVSLFKRYGPDLVRLAPEPGFLDLFEALSWVADEPGPPELYGWLGRRLREMRPEDITMMTELFLTHRGSLRNDSYSAILEDSWMVLRRLRGTNPGLADLLLEHRDVWPMLGAPGFVDAMGVQFRLDRAQAQRFLIFLLGARGARYEMSGEMPWSNPLPDDFRATALRIAEDNDGVVVGAMFQWRGEGAFWRFASDEQKRNFIPCLVQKEANDPARLGKYLETPARALAQICRPEPSMLVRVLPGSGAYLAAVKAWNGAPLDTTDILGAGLDTFDIALIVVPGAGSAVKGLGMFGRLIAPSKGAIVEWVESTTKTIVVSGIRSELTAAAEREASNFALGVLNSGVGRTFGIGAETVLEAMQRNPQTSRAIRYLLGDKVDELAVGHALEYAVSTEIFRCFRLPEVQREDDQICQSLLPAIFTAAPEGTKP